MLQETIRRELERSGITPLPDRVDMIARRIRAYGKRSWPAPTLRAAIRMEIAYFGFMSPEEIAFLMESDEMRARARANGTDWHYC
jgi:hypothetical protein